MPSISVAESYQSVISKRHNRWHRNLNEILKWHYIPSNPQIKDIRIERVNNPKRFLVDPKNLKYYAVCDIHFDQKCKEENGIWKFALLTLNLPEALEKLSSQSAGLVMDCALDEPGEFSSEEIS
ncbi:hypothetical protein QE152_g8073 [Popillia japonica]|uniref:Uncharacterized protein n=1 Tax=Popillia japonica TaxID=7064 RepID=A0AAW1MDM2_POPJA